MKRIIVLGLGIVIVAATASSVFATTDTIRNANCNVSIESKQEVLKQYVQDGKITQEKADEILAQIENCDGTGNARIGKNNGVKFGNVSGQGRGLERNCQLQK